MWQDTHVRHWEFVKDSEVEIQDDKDILSLAECYIHSVHHFMELMNQHIIQLENQSVTTSDMHDIMISLKNKLENRLR